MMEKNTIKNYEISALKEFLGLNKKFADFLYKSKKLLSKNNVTQAMEEMEFFNYYSEKMSELKEKLPSREIVIESGYGPQLKELNEKISSLSKEVWYLLEVQHNIARKGVEFATEKVRQKSKDEATYNKIGEVNLPKEKMDPITIAQRI